MRGFLVLMALALAAVLGITACGDDPYTKADLIEDLQETGGLEADQAVCVADGYERAGIDIAQLGQKVSPGDPINKFLSGKEQATMATIVSECLEPPLGPVID